MHKNSPFRNKKCNNFLGRGHPLPRPNPPPVVSIFAPTALNLNVTPPKKILVTALAKLAQISSRRCFRPSHADIDSKLMTIGSCSFHHRVARDSSFSIPTFVPQERGEPLETTSNETGYVGQTAKKLRFLSNKSGKRYKIGIQLQSTTTVA